MKINYKKVLLEKIEGKESLSDKFNKVTNNKQVTVVNQKNVPKSWTMVHFKTYPRLGKIKLTRSFSKQEISLLYTLKNRCSTRIFSGLPISAKDLSFLLLHSSGIVSIEANMDESRRPYPSAGARYPLEIYPLVLNGGDEVKAGLYHYNVKDHCLEIILEEDLKQWTLEATGNFKLITKASTIFIITGVLDRTRMKYDDRGYRYVLIEAGHMSQNLLLLATGLEMANLAIGGYVDSKITKILDLELTKEVPLYMIAVGKNV